MMQCSSRFGYNPNKKTFIAEMSSLDHPVWVPIYENAIDEGICIRSHISGNIARFQLARTCCQNGKIDSWILCPTVQTVMVFRELAGHFVTILNS